MSTEGPKPYPVVYDAVSGNIQYSFQSGYVSINTGSSGITALTGDVTATGPGSAAATISDATVTSKLLTGYVSGAGTVAASDTILQGVNKLNGNAAAISVVANAALPSASFTDAAVTGKLITGYVSGAGTVASSDTILQAINKLNGNTAAKVSTTLTSTHILVGNGSNVATDVALSGDATMANTGAITLATVTVGKGGTGLTTLTAHDVLVGTGSSAVTLVSPSTSGFVLTSNSTSSDPSFKPSGVGNVSTLATTGTVTPDSTAANTFYCAVSGAVTMNGPSGGTDGQKVTFRILNDASHSVTLATGSGNFRYGTDITGYTNSVSKTDYIGAIWNNADTRWDVVSVIQGF